jgi:glycyl-tRNA synthetase beta chain
MSAPLLVELITEELPPRALKRLGDAFANGIANGLIKAQLASPAAGGMRLFATPRRLAVLISDVSAKGQDRAESKKLMPSKVGFAADGAPSAALLKKLEKEGGSIAQVVRKADGGEEYAYLDQTLPGMTLAAGLQAALEETLAALPIPRMMSYQLADGATTVEFVRPAHALVALHGADVVPVTLLGLAAGRITHGHRFQGAQNFELKHADEYEARLENEGAVIASFDTRQQLIFGQLDEQAGRLGCLLGASQDYLPLLDEVTALVEFPAVYPGSFEEEFLNVPQECLTLTMRQNQKYFPLFVEGGGKLANRFLIVSNMRLDDPRNVIEGNQRVIRPRLADARFFFDTDCKVKLAERVAQLSTIVYHNKLGTQLDRVERLRKLATRIQSMLPRGAKGMPYADRAALLAKADLVTLMVGEFPELQGVMGKYYAEADGEEPSVVRAIEQHYWPRFSGDALPSGDVSIAVALADKLETLVGIWGAGQQPTGEKDPFGLRRAALGVLRILSEKSEAMDLDLGKLLDEAASGFSAGLAVDTVAGVHAFMLDRLRSMLRERGYDANEIEAVLAGNPTQISRVWNRIEAVKAFRELPEAGSLAAANKRIQNILRKSGHGDTVSPLLFAQDEEKRLHTSLESLVPRVAGHLERKDYAAALKDLAGIRNDVDAFFDKVLVNAEDEKVRNNRLALLTRLGGLMNRVADISKLAA